MALTATTLVAAITANQLTFTLTSGTNVIAPNFTAVPAGAVNANILYLMCEQELMQVQGVNGAVVTVQRGYNGTLAVAHGVTAPVLTGYPSDFYGFVPAQKSDVPYLPFGSVAFSAPLTGATITPQGPYFHFTGTVALVTINLPNYLNEATTYPGAYPENPIAGCQISIVFDGSSTGLTWTAAGNINVAGTSTTAGSMVTFTYDPSISKWIPSRLA
jgi:hypothetical protein